jgi:hypothetical protein
MDIDSSAYNVGTVGFRASTQPTSILYLIPPTYLFVDRYLLTNRSILYSIIIGAIDTRSI